MPDDTLTVDAPVSEPRRPRRLAARVGFVVLLALLGAAAGGVLAGYTDTATEVVTRVDVAGVDPADLLPDARALSGDNGERLTIEIDGSTMLFKVTADNAEIASTTATTVAAQFAQAHPGVATPRGDLSVTDARPTRWRFLLIGAAGGAIVGSVLQTGLRPRRVEPDTVLLPAWSRGDSVDTVEAAQSLTPAAAPPAAVAASSGRSPAPLSAIHGQTRLTQSAASLAPAPSPTPATGGPALPADPPTIDIPGPDPADTDSADPNGVDTGRADTDSADTDSADTDSADTDSADTDGAHNARADTADADPAAAPSAADTDPLGPDLGEEQADALALERTRAERLEQTIARLEADISSERLEAARLREAFAAQADQDRLEGDLATENAFLRTEVERYQRSVAESRISHTRALAEVELSHQEDVDRLLREHRFALSRASHDSRTLVATHQARHEAVIAELEARHRRQLDAAHQAHEQRVAEVRHHVEDRLAATEQRLRHEVANDHGAELQDRLDELAALQREHAETLDALATERDRSTQLERLRRANAVGTTQTMRLGQEDRRRLEQRVSELRAQLERAEARLQRERKRTNDVVRNLLTESAASVARAEEARRHEAEQRAALEQSFHHELERLHAEARAFEQAAAERERTLEALITALRDGAE